MAEARPKGVLLYFNDVRPALDVLSDADAGLLFKRLLGYADKREEPCFDGAENPPAVEMAFRYLRAAVDRDAEQYERVCERNRRNAQKKAGQAIPVAPTGCQSLPVGSNPKPNPNPNSNTNPNPSSKPNPYTNDGAAGKRSEDGEFVPPDAETVKAYCQERRNSVDADTFVDHYTSNGWMVGSTPMKDWKAAVRSWEKRDGRGHTPKGTPAPKKGTAGFSYHFDENGEVVIDV